MKAHLFLCTTSVVQSCFVHHETELCTTRGICALLFFLFFFFFFFLFLFLFSFFFLEDAQVIFGFSGACSGSQSCTGDLFRLSWPKGLMYLCIMILSSYEVYVRSCSTDTHFSLWGFIMGNCLDAPSHRSNLFAKSGEINAPCDWD